MRGEEGIVEKKTLILCIDVVTAILGHQNVKIGFLSIILLSYLIVMYLIPMLIDTFFENIMKVLILQFCY